VVSRRQGVLIKRSVIEKGSKNSGDWCKELFEISE